jgi:hypothetical protein
MKFNGGGFFYYYYAKKLRLGSIQFILYGLIIFLHYLESVVSLEIELSRFLRYFR